MAQEPDEIREAIEQTRADIGDTLEAIVAKTDVKARAADKVSEQRARLRTTSSDLRTRAARASSRVHMPLGSILIVAAGAFTVLIAVAARSRHRREG